MPNVRCCDCGYLSLREVYNRELYSPEATYRETGEPPMASSISPFPICLMRACDFRTELKVQREGHHSSSVKIVDVIRRDRPCDKFTIWQQGLSPKEHLQMDILERQAERDRKWRQEDVAMAKEAMKVSVRSYLVAAVIGAIATLAAVALGYLLNRAN